MSSPTNSEMKDSSFSASDPIPTGQDEEQQQHVEEDQNPPHPQAPKIETLEIPDADEPNPSADDPNHDDAEEIAPISPTISHVHNPSSTSTLTFSRRFGGGKRKKRNAAQEKKSQKKLKTLTGTLNLISFMPVKTLDLSSHEVLLRRLGLWDFSHLDFDFKLRHDLIFQLIANFNPSSRSSKVNDFRIKVSRADLARALGLPVKKDKGDTASEVKESEESVSFIQEFVSSFILLHDDIWIMSEDIMNTMKLIKEGNLEKVDFATLIWTMVEKELKKDLNNHDMRNCYYATHLQLLIRSQREELLKEQEPVNTEIDLKEDEEDEEEGLKTSEKLELPATSELEEQNIELSLGGLDSMGKGDGMKEKQELEQVPEQNQEQEQEQEQLQVPEKDQDQEKNQVQDQDQDQDQEKNQVQDQDQDEEKSQVQVHDQDQEKNQVQVQDQDREEEHQDDEGDAMDFEESKENEEGQWYNNNTGGTFLQRCNLEDFGDQKQEEEDDDEEEEDDEDEGKEGEYGEKEEEEEEEEMGFSILPKGVSLEGIDADNLIEAVEASQNPFTSGLQSRDSVTVPGGSSLFNHGNGSKRIIDHLDDEMPHHKRIRSDEHWDNLKPESEFDICIDQMQHITGKVRMLYETKEQELQNLSMHNQMLLTELEQRNNMYHHNLAKAKMEEQQKRQMETYRFEHELYMMSNLLEGYRKALKETSKAFSEYRKKFPSHEEPIYKDTGSGGLVLSTTELEKQRLKHEEEERVNRLLIERKIKEFEAGWITKLEECETAAEFMGNRLLDVEKGVDFCREEVARRKVSKMLESVTSEEQVTQETAAEV